MTQDLYTYIQQMHALVHSQEKRIRDLEKSLKNLQQELNNLKSRPPVHVDTIQYKFDQLKVETLEGTLNIGLNPSDLEGIEDFEVQNKNISTPSSPKEQMERTMEIEDRIFQYLETDLKALISNYEEQLDRKIEESYIDFIREDIKKQLPSRIEHYLKQIPNNERSAESKMKVNDQIEKQIKQDIEKAVLAFLQNLPNNGKD